MEDNKRLHKKVPGIFLPVNSKVPTPEPQHVLNGVSNKNKNHHEDAKRIGNQVVPK